MIPTAIDYFKIRTNLELYKMCLFNSSVMKQNHTSYKYRLDNILTTGKNNINTDLANVDSDLAKKLEDRRSKMLNTNNNYFTNLGFLINNKITTNLHNDLAVIRYIVATMSTVNNIKFSVELGIFTSYIIVISPSSRSLGILSFAIIPTFGAADVIRHQKIINNPKFLHNLDQYKYVDLTFEQLVYDTKFNLILQNENFYIIMTDISYYVNSIDIFAKIALKINSPNYLIGTINTNLFLSEGYITVGGDETPEQSAKILGQVRISDVIDAKNKPITMDVLGNFQPYNHNNQLDILNLVDILVVDIDDCQLTFKVDYQLVYSTARYVSILVTKSQGNDSVGKTVNSNIVHNKFKKTSVTIVNSNKESDLDYSVHNNLGDTDYIFTTTSLAALDSRLLSLYETGCQVELPEGSNYVCFDRVKLTVDDLMKALQMSGITMYGDTAIQFCLSRLRTYMPCE